MNQTTLAQQAYLEAIKSWQKRCRWLKVKQMWSNSAWVELTSKEELIEAAQKRLKDLGVGAKTAKRIEGDKPELQTHEALYL